MTRMSSYMKSSFPVWLGLNKNETLMLGLISKYPAINISDLAQRIKVARTTLYTPLSQLIKRKLVVAKKQGREKVFSLAAAQYPWQSKEETPADITFIKGVESFLSLINKTVDINRGDRVRWIQPNGALRILLEKGDLQDLIRLNNKIVSSGIIIEALLEDDYFRIYKSIVGNERFKEVAKSFIGRPYEGYAVRPGVLDEFTEIITFSHHAALINWKSGEGFVTSKKDLVSFFNGYIDLMESSSKKVDMTSVVKSYL